MRVWEVTVDCWYGTKRGHRGVRRVFQIESSSYKEVSAKALAHAENTCGGEREWTGFEFIQAISVEFPRELIHLRKKLGKGSTLVQGA